MPCGQAEARACATETARRDYTDVAQGCSVCTNPQSTRFLREALGSAGAQAPCWGSSLALHRLRRSRGSVTTARVRTRYGLGLNDVPL